MSQKRRDSQPGPSPTGASAPHHALAHDDYTHSHRHTHAAGATQYLHGTPTFDSGSASPTLADSQAPATSSANVQLSSKTIVALGMGFIGAAVVVVGITVLLRINVVARAARRERARGEDVTFRQMWDRWGGAWGLLFAPGERLDTWGGGVVVKRKKVGPPPKMWDVDVAKLEPRDEFDMADEGVQPLAAAPYYAPGSKVPECAFSVLVVMPAPPRVVTENDDDEPELPDIMLGTTHLQPTIPLADAGIKGDAESDNDDNELEYVYPVHELMRMRTRQQAHWATVWGIDAGGRIP